jgi:hypothetical protein
MTAPSLFLSHLLSLSMSSFFFASFFVVPSPFCLSIVHSSCSCFPLQGRSRGTNITSNTDERHDDAALPSARHGLRPIRTAADASGAAPNGLAKRITFPIHDCADAHPDVSASYLLFPTWIDFLTVL